MGQLQARKQLSCVNIYQCSKWMNWGGVSIGCLVSPVVPHDERGWNNAAHPLLCNAVHCLRCIDLCDMMTFVPLIMRGTGIMQRFFVSVWHAEHCVRCIDLCDMHWSTLICSGLPDMQFPVCVTSTYLFWYAVVCLICRGVFLACSGLLWHAEICVTSTYLLILICRDPCDMQRSVLTCRYLYDMQRSVLTRSGHFATCCDLGCGLVDAPVYARTDIWAETFPKPNSKIKKRLLIEEEACLDKSDW